MQRLLDFLYGQREVGIFLFLEIFSVWLLISFNQRPNATYFNSSNYLAANIEESTSAVSSYFELGEINERLMKENEVLQAQIRQFKTLPDAFVDTVERYQAIGAKVVANTISRGANFMTVSAGLKDSIEVGMGVISYNGIVGQVKSVSQHFATVYSVLHPNLLISSKVKRTQTKGTVQWDQQDPYHASLKYIPRHIKLHIGDTVVTSGFNSVFPDNFSIGVIDEFNLEDQMTFYEARIKLTADLSSLDYVYLIKDHLKAEKDSIELL